MNTNLIMKLAYSFLLSIVVTLQCTAYTHSTQPTASGVMPQDVDMHELVVTDRFGGNHNNRMDIFMASESECWRFGRKNLVCEVEIPK